MGSFSAFAVLGLLLTVTGWLGLRLTHLQETPIPKKQLLSSILTTACVLEDNCLIAVMLPLSCSELMLLWPLNAATTFRRDVPALMSAAIAPTCFSFELPSDNLLEDTGRQNAPSLCLIVPAAMDTLGQHARTTV